MSDAIEAILGHHFPRPELLREALTHRSALHRAAAAPRGSNERLEFIGDRVLGLVMAEWLAERFPREQEGDLGRRLAYLVSQPVLAAVAEAIGLAAALSVAPGEAKAGVQARAPCWPTRWRRRWVRSISMAAWTPRGISCAGPGTTR